MKRIAAIVLTLLAIAMIFIGVTKMLLPPALTGIGFLVIAGTYLMDRN